MTGQAMAAQAAVFYAAAAVVAVLAAGWLWARPGLISGVAAGAVMSVTVVLPWWLLTVVTYAPVGQAAPEAATVAVCVSCALLAGWRSRR